jgi:hypothetical protein
MTNFLHLKINIGNNNLTLGIYHKAVETDTPILNTSNHLEENKKVIQIQAEQNKTENRPITHKEKKGSTLNGKTNSPQQ